MGYHAKEKGDGAMNVTRLGQAGLLFETEGLRTQLYPQILNDLKREKLAREETG